MSLYLTQRSLFCLSGLDVHGCAHEINSPTSVLLPETRVRWSFCPTLVALDWDGEVGTGGARSDRTGGLLPSSAQQAKEGPTERSEKRCISRRTNVLRHRLATTKSIQVLKTDRRRTRSTKQRKKKHHLLAKNS